MTEKQLKALGAILIVLVALVALARWNASRPTTKAAPPVNLKTLQDSVDKVVLSSSEGSVTLAKSSVGWSVGGSAADTGTVSKLWKTVEGATFDDIVSSNPANQATFGVSGPSARTFAFFSGPKKEAELVFGNATDAPGSVYVKVGGGKDVWSVTGDFTTIPTKADAWRAKRVPAKPTATPKPGPKP